MKKYVNVRLDGWARHQNNVIEMAARVQGAKAGLPVLQFGEKSCSQQWVTPNMARMGWIWAMYLEKLLEGSAMSRKKNNREEL